ncbi:superoxide dismutase [Tieghemostelium lacteum]|uniref:Superoxide dismutase n=1 Tax=Tieghemostelium lacteum TaxID=361077 RepID=A0A152A771_TIELA|nr:superoxide dismutase [Tieghemostelium lacteum]|eukprot:KYR01971.1 superoxide dismutase [Tieghemostelium lacteum]
MIKQIICIILLSICFANAANEVAICSFAGSTFSGNLYIGYNDNSRLELFWNGSTAATFVAHNTGDLNAALSASTILGSSATLTCDDTRGFLAHVSATSSAVSSNSNVTAQTITGANSLIGYVIAAYANAPSDCDAVTYAGLGNLLGKCVLGVADLNSNEVGTLPAGFTSVVTVDQLVSNQAQSFYDNTLNIVNLFCQFAQTQKFNYTGTFSGSALLSFNKTSGDTTITAKFGGLDSLSTHGLHIHTFGDLSVNTGASVGPHWNTSSTQTHNLPPANTRHTGDLGNVCTYLDGVAYYKFTTNYITWDVNGLNPIGRGMALHRNRDDGTTTSFGDRIATCVLGNLKSSAPAAPINIPATLDFSSNSDAVCTQASTTASTTTTTSSTTSSSTTTTGDSGNSSALVQVTYLFTIACVLLSLLF